MSKLNTYTSDSEDSIDRLHKNLERYKQGSQVIRHQDFSLMQKEIKSEYKKLKQSQSIGSMWPPISPPHKLSIS